MPVVKWNPVSKLVSDVLTPPQPARLYQPEWYKQLNAFYTQKPEFSQDGKANATLKHCLPFSDAMNAGYILESWQDIRFEGSASGDIQYFYPTQPPIIGHRNHQSMKLGRDFWDIEFTLILPWQPQLPKGWSMLYTQPINRPELPFYFPSGIVDVDKFTHANNDSNLPFYLKKTFTGTLPAGTPLVQLIPFRRDDWISKKNVFNESENAKMAFQVQKLFWGGYKKSFWTKKQYK
jgi:hypothetical protein